MSGAGSLYRPYEIFLIGYDARIHFAAALCRGDFAFHAGYIKLCIEARRMIYRPMPAFCRMGPFSCARPYLTVYIPSGRTSRSPKNSKTARVFPSASVKV